MKCFAHYLEQQELHFLNEHRAEVEYSPGQVITKEASFNTRIIYITSGLIKIVKEGKNGKNTIIRVLGANNFLTVPIHENQKRFAYTAIAVSEVTLCEINEPAIHDLIAKNQKFINYLMDHYYDDQLFLLQKIHDISAKNNHGRIASSLLYLNTLSVSGRSVYDYFSRKEIAELSATSLESVNKILQELNNDKIIAISKSGLQINNLFLLQKLSQLG